MSIIAAVPKVGVKSRPALPSKHRNPLLDTVESDPVVKYQIIEREGQEIVIGRVKVPVPDGGHAFILRRFDTGAVSLTTMFRAAYPAAGDNAEKLDAAWVKAAYDISGANGGSKGQGRQYLRLAGTWLPPDVALAIAESYTVERMVRPLVDAEPDMDQQFRRSNKANGSGEPRQTANAPSPSPSPSTKALAPSSNKRRKASPASTTVPLSPPSTTTNTRRLRSSKSPAPLVPKASAKPTSRRGAKTRVPTPPEEEAEEELPELGHVDIDVDIEESKRLVEEVKASYRKPRSNVKNSLKRINEEEPLIFTPKEPEDQERKIAGPKRLRNLPPQRQAVAWGALAFAIGLGATAFLPQLF